MKKNTIFVDEFHQGASAQKYRDGVEQMRNAVSEIHTLNESLASSQSPGPLNYLAHYHNALRASVEYAVEEIARLACEIDGQHLHILTASLSDAAKDMQAAIVAQWGELRAHEQAAPLRDYPISR